MLCLVGRGSSAGRKFLPHEHTIAATLDTPTRDGIERRHAQQLAGAQTEAGVMQGATDLIADNQALGQGAAIVGTVGADGEDVLAAADQEHIVLTQLALQQRAVR